MTYKVIDGPLVGKEIEFNGSKYVFFEKKDNKITVHNYLINEQDKTLSFKDSYQYETNDTANAKAALSLATVTR